MNLLFGHAGSILGRCSTLCFPMEPLDLPQLLASRSMGNVLQVTQGAARRILRVKETPSPLARMGILGTSTFLSVNASEAQQLSYKG